MIKRLICVVAALVATTSMTSAFAADAPPKDKVTLLLNWYLYSEHAPFFLGKERGYYEREGIDLEIQEGRGSGPTAQAVAAGSATFGYIDITTMIKAASKGAPVESTGVLLQSTPMAVMGYSDKNVRTPKDIVGKTVAVTPGDAPSQIWPLFLKVNGITQDQFKTVSGDAQTKLNAVINGQADVLIGYVMDQGIKLQDATHKPVTSVRFADSGITLINSGIIVNKDLIANKPDLIKRFMRATTQAVEDAEKDPAAAVDAMLKANPKAGTRDTLIVGMKDTAALYHTKETTGQKPFRVTMKNVNDSINVLIEYGGLDPATRGKAAEFVTLDFLPN